MARDDKSLDELDEEMAKLEAELRALEEGEEPEDLDLEEGSEEEETQGPEDDDTEEPDQDGGGLLSKLPFGRSKRGKDEEDQTASDEEEPAEAEPAPEPGQAEETEPSEDIEEDTEDDGGAIKGLIGRFKRDREATEEDEPPEAEPAPEAGQAEEVEPPGEPDEDPEGEPDETPDEDDGAIKGLIGRFKRDKEATEDDEPPEAEPGPEPGQAEEAQPPEAPPAEEGTPPETLASEAPAPEPETPEEEALTEEETRHRRASDLWERTPEERWLRKDPAEGHAEEAEPAEEDEGEGRARALLARFGGSGSADEEEEETSDATALVPVEEEDDDGRPIPIWVLWILLGIAIVGLLAAAVVLLGDDDGGVGGGQAPTAAATVSQGSPAPGGGFVALVDEEITFDASETTGTVESYAWDFGDGQTATTETPTTTYTYASTGSYEVTLTVAGDDGEDTTSIDVLVVQAPQAVPAVLVDGEPAAAPGETGAHPSVGEPVTLDGSGSSADPESPLASYAWDLDGDGTADANGETAQATFDAVGAWTVSLTVTDDLGNTDTSEVTVGVGRTDTFEGTVGQAIGEPSTSEHPLPVDAGRQGADPFELTATLNYTPPQAGLNENVDLVLIDPDGNEFPAEDDEGSGQETLTLSGGDLVPGDWTVQVRHQNPSTNSVDYQVTVELVY